MEPGAPLTGWRRVAHAMWSPPNDPQIFGALEIDARPVQQFIRRARAAGHHVTATHLVGRGLAHAFVKVPDLNVQLKRGRVFPRPSIDIFFITAVRGGHDLSGVKVKNVPGHSVVEIANEVAERSSKMKAGRDRDFARTKRLMDKLPPWLLRPAIRAASFVTDNLAVDIPMLALRKHPFGSAMVTSVGMFGLPSGFAPLAWMYGVPVLLCVGEIADRPIVVDGKVEACPILPVTASIDHRYVDGWHISQAMAAFREYLAAPELFEPVVGLHAA